LGTTDPSGWVICDGKGRFDNNRNIYNNLTGMNIGRYDVSGSLIYYYPPNYKGAFLRGIGGSGSYVGPTSVDVSQNDDVGKHSHGITDQGHDHTDSLIYGKMTSDLVYAGQNISKFENVPFITDTTGIGTRQKVGKSTTGISVNNNTGTETRPYNFGVNWIIRY
jgi:hypothetical protein